VKQTNNIKFMLSKMFLFFQQDMSTSRPKLHPSVLTKQVKPCFQPNSRKFPKVCYTQGRWQIHSTGQAGIAVLEDDTKSWEESRQILSNFNFSTEESDKMLKKAFGWVNSPYWSEEREKETPKVQTISQILEYLTSLGLSDEDLQKLLKKFPEVLGCSLHKEIKLNVGLLEKDWGISGKTLRSLLLRNPKVLGYNVDCKGDCIAKCTRCWVRF
jgi:mTERF